MVDDPSGWLCIADPDWLDYLATQSDLRSIVYYKGPYRPLTQLPLDAPFICCRKGETPRRIHLIGKFNGYHVLTNMEAWNRYHRRLGAPTLDKWNTLGVGKDGKISCHELINFRFFDHAPLLEETGVTITDAASSMGRYLSRQESHQITESVGAFPLDEVFFPEEVPNPFELHEGAYSQILVNKFERNARARELCVEYYGPICAVCDFRFIDLYGQIGHDFIHVHHLVRLSSITAAYVVDPIADLRPVCPNCHAMLHKSDPPYSIDELKRLIELEYKRRTT